MRNTIHMKLTALTAIAAVCFLPAITHAQLEADSLVVTNALQQTSAAASSYFMGKLGIANVSPAFTLDVKGNILRTANNGNANTQLLFDRYSSTTTRYGYLSFRKSASDIFDTLAATAAEEYLGSISFSGIDSGNTAFRASCGIIARQDGASGASAVPGRLEFHTSTDSAAFQTRMVIKSDGSIGIGTATPAEKLHVAGIGRFTGGGLFDGYVGVGTTAPEFPLDVKGNILRTANSGDANTQLLFDRYSSNDSRYGYLSFRKSGTDVFGDTIQTVAEEYLGSMSFSGVDSANTSYRVGAGIICRQDGNASATAVPARLEFHTSTDSAAFQTRLVIKNDGKVGVGTTTPTELLHVAGTARFDSGVSYIAPLGDLSMGTFTNAP